MVGVEGLVAVRGEPLAILVFRIGTRSQEIVRITTTLRNLEVVIVIIRTRIRSWLPDRTS